jgi:type IV pilus assembly protein PilV
MRPEGYITPAQAQRGLTMLEVLITIVILAFGLLGLAGLQARMQVAEVEAYQRAQAIVLLQDMVDRINANRQNATAYGGIAAGKTYNSGNVEDCTGKTGKDLDLCQWHNALLGASEIAGGSNLGAMIDAHGCVTAMVATPPREFQVSVVWQGLTPTSAPAAANTCNVAPTNTMRAIVARVQIGCLQNYPAGHAQAGQCCTAATCP